MANAFIRKIISYGELCNDEVAALSAVSMPVHSVAAHKDLIHEGDKPDPLYVILDGWACRYKLLPDGSRQIVAFLMPGDFSDLHIGELDAMDHSICAVTSCQIATVARQELEQLIVSTPALTKAFWRAQLIDESVLRAWIVSIGRRSSLERVAHLMLELYIRMRNVGLADDGVCEMPLTQIVLADALGLTPVHINRVLSKLRQQRIMEIGSKTLKILSKSDLARVAGYDENYLHRRIRMAA